jgi:predicted HAD superfamily hydrolase
MLDQVRRMVLDRSCSVLSFDIFDTVLWRRTPHPADLFAVLGERLRRAGHAPGWLSPGAFRRMRIGAEQEARRRDGKSGTEVSLFDIWGAMPVSIFTPGRLAELVDAEVETERALTVVDLDIAEIVTLARHQDVPTILVSDTYFTEEQLARLLDRPELEALKSARVFRSHQHGLAKGAGLWEIVLDQVGCRPEQLLHIGDNPEADIEKPAELGIRAVHYERVDELFATVLAREHEPEDPFGRLGDHVDLEDGDFGLTSLRAKTLQRSEPGLPTATRTAWRFGASVLGPVLTGFAEWVAKRAYESNIPVLWCPMREGTLLSTLINNAAQARGWAVEARPVWLSRHVTSLAALDPADVAALKTFVRERYRLTVRQLLASLDLRPGEVPALANVLNTVLDNDRIVGLVSAALTESPHLCNRLAITVTRFRERVLRELRDSGMLDAADPAIVDLGWGGTIQYYLGKVLRDAQLEARPAGFYLATDNRSIRAHLAGLRVEGYLGQAGHPHEVVTTLSRSPEVLEQAVNDLCGSLIGFADDGSPVLGPASDSESQQVQRRSVQDGILAFQRQWNRYADNADRPWPDLTGAARDRLAAILVSALKAPTPEEATVFGNWAHEDNFGSATITGVVPDDLAAAIPYLSPNDLADLDMRDAFWPALLAASDPALGAAARALASGAVEPSMFELTAEPSKTRLAVHAGGKWYDGDAQRVRINHNGLSFARLGFWSGGGDIHHVAVAIPGRPAIVRVDWIEVKAVPVGQDSPQIVRWEQPDDFAGLVHAACTWLGGTMFEFETTESAIWLPLAARLGAPVSSGQVTVAFAMLPRSRTGLDQGLPAGSRLTRVSSRVRQEYRARGPVGLASAVARVATRQLRNGQ